MCHKKKARGSIPNIYSLSSQVRKVSLNVTWMKSTRTLYKQGGDAIDVMIFWAIVQETLDYHCETLWIGSKLALLVAIAIERCFFLTTKNALCLWVNHHACYAEFFKNTDQRDDQTSGPFESQTHWTDQKLLS